MSAVRSFRKQIIFLMFVLLLSSCLPFVTGGSHLTAGDRKMAVEYLERLDAVDAKGASFAYDVARFPLASDATVAGLLQKVAYEHSKEVLFSSLELYGTGVQSEAVQKYINRQNADIDLRDVFLSDDIRQILIPAGTNLYNLENLFKGGYYVDESNIERLITDAVSYDSTVVLTYYDNLKTRIYLTVAFDLLLLVLLGILIHSKFRKVGDKNDKISVSGGC